MLAALLTIVLIYLLMVGTLYLLQRRMMYIPFGGVPDPVAAGVPEMRPVGLRTADGLTLLAWWRPAREPERPVLVYFHGNAGHLGLRGHKLRPFLDAGFGVLLPAYRGFSGNPGAPTEEGLYADARAALEFVRAAGVPPQRTVLYGESLGTGVAVQMAIERPVAAVVLEAPFSAIADVASARYPFIPVRLLLKDRFDSASKIGRIRAPVLIFAGGRDRVVPERFARRLYEAAVDPKELRILPEATHLDFHEHGAPRHVLDFLDRQLTRTPARKTPG